MRHYVWLVLPNSGPGEAGDWLRQRLHGLFFGLELYLRLVGKVISKKLASSDRTQEKVAVPLGPVLVFLRLSWHAQRGLGGLGCLMEAHVTPPHTSCCLFFPGVTALPLGEGRSRSLPRFKAPGLRSEQRELCHCCGDAGPSDLEITP